MYVRILGIVVGAILTCTTMTQPASAATADPTTYGTGQDRGVWDSYTCRVADNPKTGLFEDVAISGRKWVDVDVKPTWDQCTWRTSGRKFIHPLSYTAAYNVQGTGIDCGWPAALVKVTFNGYFWDNSGANYNPGPVELRCEEDTTGFNAYSLADAPRMRHCDGVPPKFKFNITLHLRWQKDRHMVLSGSMWAFIGPMPRFC